MKESLTELCSNTNFWIVCACFTLGQCPLSAFTVLMSQIMETFGISVAQTSILGAGSVLLGAVVAITFGLYLDKTRAYKSSLILTNVLPAFFMIIFR